MTRPRRPRPAAAEDALAMTEREWTDWIVAAAKLHGWRVTHFRPARAASGWRTPVQGHNGFPDIVLARDGVVLMAELKVGRNRLSHDQQVWRHAIGAQFRLWRPEDREEVLAELTDHRGAPGHGA